MDDAQKAALEAYEAARIEHSSWLDRSDRYEGNNPEKYRSGIRRALERLVEAERAAKCVGALAMTNSERLAERLDTAFPNAKSRAIYEFEGQRYQRLYRPISRSNSGKSVRTYDGFWKLVGPSNGER